MEEKCLKTLSEYRERRRRCHMWWKTVPEGGARNRKSPFADSREVEQRYSKLVGGSRPESVPRGLQPPQLGKAIFFLAITQVFGQQPAAKNKKK